MAITLKQIVDDCANWFEAIGFVLSIFTAVKVFVIDKKVFDFNKKHLFQVRSAEHIQKLKEIARKITSDVSNFSSNKTSLRTQIKQSEEIATSIRNKIFNKDAEKLKKFITESKRIQSLPDDISSLGFFKRAFYKIKDTEEFKETIVDQYYIQLSGLITYLEELKKDNENSLLP